MSIKRGDQVHVHSFPAQPGKPLNEALRPIMRGVGCAREAVPEPCLPSSAAFLPFLLFLSVCISATDDTPTFSFCEGQQEERRQFWCSELTVWAPSGECSEHFPDSARGGWWLLLLSLGFPSLSLSLSLSLSRHKTSESSWVRRAKSWHRRTSLPQGERRN
ncbi:hypothetical protein BJY04DRAFT_89178 [Aspergillus karnatakaensis]|uniref:uncharacterized protein n=1 Tax=Aspergillus karnatakaensis TaxID=1810916 RepID=UPI003CCD0085